MEEEVECLLDQLTLETGNIELAEELPSLESKPLLKQQEGSWLTALAPCVLPSSK